MRILLDTNVLISAFVFGGAAGRLLEKLFDGDFELLVSDYINGHINSVKYIEHVLDLWPLEWYREHSIRRFEIAYVAEAHAGDKLSFYREQTAENEYCTRIVRGDGTECCRSKVCFR